MSLLRLSTFVAVIALMAGCGRAEADPTALRIESTSTTVGRTDPDAVCDQLGDLAAAVLIAHSASTAEDITTLIGPKLAAFAASAADSGDDELAHQASTAAEAFAAYLSGDADAGDRFDDALDASGARCVQLGYSRTLPTQPPQVRSAATCATDRKILETASEAYQALTGQLPTSQEVLIQEGLIRRRADGLEVATDGTIVVVPGGPCDG